MRHLNCGCAIKPAVLEMLRGFLQGVLTHPDGTEAEKQLAQRHGAEYRIPCRTAFGNDVVVVKVMLLNRKRSDIRRAYAQRSNLAQATKVGGLFGAKRKEKKWSAIGTASGGDACLSPQDRDNRRGVGISNVVLAS